MAGRVPLGQQIVQERVRRQSAEDRAQDAERKLEQFKVKVRELGLQVKQDNGWCDAGFNEVMRELGLPELPTGIKVKMTVTAMREVEFEVDASDLEPANRTEEGAREYLADLGNVHDYISDKLGYGDWELTQGDDLELELVTD